MKKFIPILLAILILLIVAIASFYIFENSKPSTNLSKSVNTITPNPIQYNTKQTMGTQYFGFSYPLNWIAKENNGTVTIFTPNYSSDSKESKLTISIISVDTKGATKTALEDFEFHKKTQADPSDIVISQKQVQNSKLDIYRADIKQMSDKANSKVKEGIVTNYFIRQIGSNMLIEIDVLESDKTGNLIKNLTDSVFQNEIKQIVDSIEYTN